MSSLQATLDYEPDDWQLIKTPYPYEGTKYQTELLAGYFEEEQRKRVASHSPLEKEPLAHIRHILIQPGVVATSIFLDALYWWVVPFMFAFFYIVSQFSLNEFCPVYNFLLLGSLVGFAKSPYTRFQGRICTRSPLLGTDPGCGRVEWND